MLATWVGSIQRVNKCVLDGKCRQDTISPCTRKWERIKAHVRQGCVPLVDLSSTRIIEEYLLRYLRLIARLFGPWVVGSSYPDAKIHTQLLQNNFNLLVMVYSIAFRAKICLLQIFQFYIRPNVLNKLYKTFYKNTKYSTHYGVLYYRPVEFVGYTLRFHNLYFKNFVGNNLLFITVL